MFSVCMRLFCVVFATLRRADRSFMESYRLWKMITELNKRPGPWMGWKSHWKENHYVINYSTVSWWRNPKNILDSQQLIFKLNIVGNLVASKQNLNCQYLKWITTNCLENVGTSTSQKPMGHHGQLQGWLSFSFYLLRKELGHKEDEISADIKNNT
jgi:hypothetical protein